MVVQPGSSEGRIYVFQSSSVFVLRRPDRRVSIRLSSSFSVLAGRFVLLPSEQTTPGLFLLLLLLLLFLLPVTAPEYGGRDCEGGQCEVRM